MVDKNVQRQMPPSAGMDADLYAQISAGDEVQMNSSKKTSSFIVNFMAWYMRMTLALDEKKRNYADFFLFFKRFWISLMGVLYLCGIGALCILIVTYFQFPSYIKSYLTANNIIYENIDIPGYVISQINLYGLHDKENTYRIEKLSLSSTFSDFLNKRVRRVSVDGLKLMVEDDFTKAQNFMKVLSKLEGVKTASSGIQIDALDVSGATLSLKGEDYELPISFSVTGMYGRESKIGSSIEIDQPYLKAKGSLSVKNTKDGAIWELSIPSGTVSFPGRSGETMNLVANMTTNDGKVEKFSGNMELKLDQLKKKFEANFSQTKKSTFDGTIQMNWSEMGGEKNPIEKTNVRLELAGLSIGKDGNISTKDPIKLEMNAAYNTSNNIRSLSAVLSGELKCKLSDKCQFDLKKTTRVKVAKMQFDFIRGNFLNTTPVSFSLTPSENTIVLFPKKGDLQLGLNIQNFSMVNGDNFSKYKTTLNVGDAVLKGALNIWDYGMLLSLDLKGMKYDDNLVTVDGAALFIEDLMKTDSLVSFSADTVALKNVPVLKDPVKVSYIKKDNRTYMDIKLKTDEVHAFYGGFYDLTSGKFDGNLIVPIVDLAKINKPLSQISDIFSEDITGLSGKVAAYGRISGYLGGVVQGPLNIALSQISFKKRENSVSNLSAALRVSSLYPFLTDSSQSIYIEKLDSNIPLQNVNLKATLSNQYAQIEKITVQAAGISLYGTETLIPYRNVGTLLYLRNNTVDLREGLSQLNIPDWQLSGNVKGSVILPLSIKDFDIGVRNASIQFSDLSLDYVGEKDQKPDFMGGDKSFSVKVGQFSCEEGLDKDEGLKLLISLDGKTEPSQKKQVLREQTEKDIKTFIKNIPNIGEMPLEIKNTIQDIFEQVKIAGGK